MARSVGSSCAKYILFFFNFALFVIGGVLLATGIWLKLDKKSFFSFTSDIGNNDQIREFEQIMQPSVISQVAYVMMATGAIIFVISYLGCSGACQESKCLLTLYGILLATILLLEITAVGLAMVYKGKAEEKTRNFLQSTIKSYYKPDRSNDTNAVTVMWNVLMAEMSCCGVDNYLDFNSSPSFKENSTQVVPQACCVLADVKKITPKFPNCTQSPSSVNSYYMSGCYERVRNWVMDHINIVIYVIIGVILVELFSVFLAFCLCMSIGRYYDK